MVIFTLTLLESFLGGRKPSLIVASLLLLVVVQFVSIPTAGLGSFYTTVTIIRKLLNMSCILLATNVAGKRYM